MNDSGWQVLPLQQSDLAGVKELQPPEFVDIIPFIQHHLDASYCYPVKVVIDGRIAGIGATILHEHSAWLAHIIVHPEFRNRGLGRFITQKLIDSVDALVHPTIWLIATAMGEPVYKKLGFVTESEYLFFKDGKADPTMMNNENIKPFESKFTKALFNLDQSTTGENRELRLREQLHAAFIYEEQGSLQGFYFPTLGDGLIVAENTTAGTALMNLRLQTRTYSILPADNKPATDFLLKNDFKHFRTAPRMYLGKKMSWKPQNLYNRIGGHVG